MLASWKIRQRFICHVFVLSGIVCSDRLLWLILNHCLIWLSQVFQVRTNVALKGWHALLLPLNGLEGMIPDSLRDFSELMEVVMSVNFGWTKIMDLEIWRPKTWSRSIFPPIDIQKFMRIGRAKRLQELYLDDFFFFGGINPIIYKLPQLKIFHA